MQEKIGNKSLGTRGKRSVAELMILEGPNGVIDRPDAPYNLTDAEADEWRAIVASMPAGHFARTQYPMLVQLCRHKVAADRVAQLIEAVCRKKKFNSSELLALQAAQSAESSAIMRLSRSMRLTQQSVYRANATGRLSPTTTIEAPWARSRQNENDED